MSNNNQMLHQSVYKQENHIAQPTTRRRIQDRNVNPFEFLYNEPECYNCHNFGHKATKFYLKYYKTYSKIKYTAERKVWKKKENHYCDLVFSAKKQKDPWYIDSGCSKHMSGDKGKFIFLTEHKSGNVTFGNDAPGKIRGKRMVNLRNIKGKS